MVTPNEAKLLSDPTLQPVVRFRFAGEDFPPRVVYKVFLTKGVSSVVYMSGKRMITPASEVHCYALVCCAVFTQYCASEANQSCYHCLFTWNSCQAAIDSLDQMGRRKFLDQMVEDEVQAAFHGAASEAHVTSVQEFMQLTSSMDNQPAYLGGRDNGWRLLQSEVQHGVLYDFLEYFNGGDLSDNLATKVPGLRPPTVFPQDTQVERIRASHAREKLLVDRSTTSKLNHSERTHRIAHMRKLYGIGPDSTTISRGQDDGSLEASTIPKPNVEDIADRVTPGMPETGSVKGVRDALNAVTRLNDLELEEEANDLVEWTNRLDIDADDI